MQKLDWVFDYAASKGMNIELILFGYGVGGGEGLWANPTRQNLWIDTLASRYKDRPNLFMYTVANEFERYPNGGYSNSASDVEWAKGVAARIRDRDASTPLVRTLGLDHRPGPPEERSKTVRHLQGIYAASSASRLAVVGRQRGESERHSE